MSGGTASPPVDLAFLAHLEQVIAERRQAAPDSSYTARLFAAGQARIAQKVGEEGVELALAAVAADRTRVITEAADLVYHLLVLLQSRDTTLAEVVAELSTRHRGP